MDICKKGALCTAGQYTSASPDRASLIHFYHHYHIASCKRQPGLQACDAMPGSGCTAALHTLRAA